MNQRGLTLVEVLLAVGIIAVVSLGAGSLLQILTASQVKLNQEIESDTFISELSGYLRKDTVCKQIFAGKTYPSVSTPQNLLIPMGTAGYRGYGSRQTVANMGAGYKPSDKLTIDQLQLVGNNDVNVLLEAKTSDDIPLRTRSAAISITYTQQIGPKKESKSINIPLKLIIRSDNNLITTCTSVEHTTATLCNTIDGHPSGPGCHTTSECRSYGAYIHKQCSDGKTACKKLNPQANYTNIFTGASSCPSNSYPIQTGKSEAVYSHHASCGKKCSYAVTTQELYVSCIKCE